MAAPRVMGTGELQWPSDEATRSEGPHDQLTVKGDERVIRLIIRMLKSGIVENGLTHDKRQQINRRIQL